MDEHRTYGVNVKVQLAPKLPDEIELSEDELGQIWEATCAGFWEAVNTPDFLSDFGLIAVFQEGRSGGWAVPEPKIDPDETPAKWEAFKRAIAQAVEHYTGTVWPDNAREAVEQAANATREYLVVGLYLDQSPPQRWATSYRTRTAEDAEQAAFTEYDPDSSKQLHVAGVIDVETGEIVA